MGEKLTAKQQKFCDKYVECGNATEAARYAGYSDKTAKDMGAENLSKPHLKAYIDARMAEISKPTIASAEEVLTFYSEVMRCDDNALPDRLTAAKELAKRWGLNVSNVKVENAIPIVITGGDELID